MRYRRGAVLVLVTAVLAGLSSVTPAGAAGPAETVPVPDPATITIDGHGYGHGHGLSQYGAEGAARQGLSYRKIVKFYYPGTSWGTAGGTVKVLITGDSTNDLVVGPRSKLTVRSLGSGRTWTLPVRRDGRTVKRWRVTPAAGHRSTVAYRTGSWHTWRVVTGDAQFAAGGQPIRLYTPAGGVQYRGILRSASATSTGTVRDTVNILPLDSYLRGVVPSEIPALWHRHAVRSQAIAARTYAAYERADAPRQRHYQICDTARCQVYGGYSAEHPASNEAVVATAGEILTSAGQPAFTQFSASSGGWTSAGSFPYLPAREDPYDGWSGNPVHTWATTTSDTTIERAWPAIGNLMAITVNSRDGNGEWGGRILGLTLTGSNGSVTMTGDDFRSRLGLRSTWLSFTAEP